MQAYVDYCHQILGIREILVNENPALKLQSVRLVFLSEPEALIPEVSAASQDLLEKMIVAMKLSFDEVSTLSLALNEISEQVEWLESLPVVVVFSEKLYHFLSSNYPKMKLFKCPSLSAMLKNAALKREAWETLKLAMKNFEKNT